MLLSFLHNAPIRQKLTVISMLTAGTALLPISVAWQVHERMEVREDMVRDISSTARVLGQTSIPALTRLDRGLAQQTIQSVNTDSRITSAALYNAEGKLFISYRAPDLNAGFIPQVAEPEGYRFGAERMFLFSKIRSTGEPIGTIYIEADLEGHSRRSRDLLLWSVLSIGAAFLAALFLARRLQQVVTEQLANLTQVASTVAAAKDYSVRAVKYGEDELGALVDQFNAMLEQIQGHDRELEEANVTLEHRVEERTRELRVEVLKLGQARQELAESQERLSLTVRCAGIGVWSWDIAANVITADANCSILFGLPLGQFPRTVEEFAALVHQDDRSRIQNDVAASVERDAEYNTQYRVVWPEGTIRYLAARGKLHTGEIGRQLIGVCWDVTERRQAEENLRAVNDKLTQSVRGHERRRSENEVLSEMFDMLQACSSASESYDIVAQCCARLFPAYAGAVYIYNASRNLVSRVAAWSDPFGSETMFEPEDCWALRRGCLHITKPGHFATPCRHVKDVEAVAHACLPLTAQSAGLGIVYFQHQQREGAQALEEFLSPEDRQLAARVAERIALSVANLRLQEALRLQSIRDPLTGLYNRRYLEESGERELHRIERRKKPAGFIMLDLDHFKNFNDTFGHEGGDAVLRALGLFLKEHLRQEDIACRYGGEEFCVLFCESSMDNTVQRAEQLRAGVKQLSVEHGGRHLGVITVSIGVSCYPTHGSGITDLIAAADSALYQAKTEGRDRVVTATTPTPRSPASGPPPNGTNIPSVLA